MTRQTPLTASRPFQVHVWGNSASFGRYDTPAEVETYNVLTPPAAEGILSSIYWHPEFTIEIQRIGILNPVQIHGRLCTEMKPGHAKGKVNLQDESSPRLRQLLHNPAYLIEARLMFKPEFSHYDSISKHADIMQSRIRIGKCYEQPYFGIREFTCHFDAVYDHTPSPLLIGGDPGTLPLFLQYRPKETGKINFIKHEVVGQENGLTIHAPKRYKGDVTAHYFRPQVTEGVIEVPPYQQYAQDLWDMDRP